MGNQKLKWTADEEETLLAGVKKHGPGKWKNILRDPDFAEKLSNRSNIDLKDKWRNLSVAPGIQGSKDKIRTPKIKAEAFALSIINPTPSPKPSPVVPPPRYELNNDDYINPDPKNAPRYDGMIFEALSALADDNGSDVGAIFNFIEQQRHEVPSNFRRILSSRLRRLAAQCKLVKVSQLKSGTQNFYKMNDNSLGTRTPIAVRVKEMNVKPQKISSQGPAVSPERVSEASVTAAYKLVEVENKLDVVKGAVEEMDRMTKLADQADVILMLAMEMHEQCSQGMIVELA